MKAFLGTPLFAESWVGTRPGWIDIALTAGYSSAMSSPRRMTACLLMRESEPVANRAIPAMLVRIKTYPDVFDRCFRAGLDRG